MSSPNSKARRSQAPTSCSPYGKQSRLSSTGEVQCRILKQPTELCLNDKVPDTCKKPWQPPQQVSIGNIYFIPSNLYPSTYLVLIGKWVIPQLSLRELYQLHPCILMPHMDKDVHYYCHSVRWHKPLLPYTAQRAVSKTMRCWPPWQPGQSHFWARSRNQRGKLCQPKLCLINSSKLRERPSVHSRSPVPEADGPCPDICHAIAYTNNAPSSMRIKHLYQEAKYLSTSH